MSAGLGEWPLRYKSQAVKGLFSDGRGRWVGANSAAVTACGRKGAWPLLEGKSLIPGYTRYFIPVCTVVRSSPSHAGTFPRSDAPHSQARPRRLSGQASLSSLQPVYRVGTVPAVIAPLSVCRLNLRVGEQPNQCRYPLQHIPHGEDGII